MEKVNTQTDASSSTWLPDWFQLIPEMDDCNLFHQCHPNLLDNEEFFSHDIASVLQGENLQQQPLSSESYSSDPLSNSETLMNSSFERPTKQQKTKHCLSDLSPSSSPSSPTSQILSFENSNSSPANNTAHFYATLNTKQNEVVPVSPPQLQNVNLTVQTGKGSSKNLNFETASPQGQGTKKSPTHAQDHVLAERKRREKLSQSLIALAALIPDLKRMDKASVLADAIKYVKELQERLRSLEEQNNYRAEESVVLINKPQLSCEDHSSSCGDGLEPINGSEALPHVDARVSNKDVLLRIHCQKQKGLLLKILGEVQNLHLLVVNSSVLPFGNSIVDITIVAQMGNGYNLTKTDLIKNVRVATLRSMS